MPPTILVVEDDDLAAETIRDTLIASGYTVPETASSGLLALDAAERLNPDLVLMDVQLDGAMDGVEAARQLRARSHVPLVYLTAFTDEETLRRAKETAPQGYLRKPFNARELRIAVEIALQQHAMERAAVAREQWFATTLGSISDAVLTTGPDSRVTFLNATAALLLGVGREEALGRIHDEVVRLVDARGEALGGLLREATAERKTVPLPRDARIARDASAPLEVEGTVAPITSEGQEPLGAVMVFRDVSERRKLERRLAMTERLAAIGTVAAGMQHELNNPLAYVVTNVHFALEGLRAMARTAPSPELGEMISALSDASEGAERLRRTVEELKPLPGGEEPPRRSVDLSGALENAARMTAHTVRHHATVRREYGRPPRVLADEAQLSRVFATLLVSAADSIGVGHAEERSIVLTTGIDGKGRAIATVVDDGPGLSPEALERLFDPFAVPGGPTSTNLALAIAHRTVTGLGGELEVESEPGRGTTYRVALPPAGSGEARAAARGTLKPQTAPGAPPRGRVLVIDDEAAIGKALGRILSREHDVSTETCARAALDRLENGERFDVIFCDLMMPNMSGMAFFEALSERSPETAARVVFLTGGAFSAGAAEFLRSIPNVCLAKPFSRDTVHAVVREKMAG